jgi:hypothetical protein
MDLDIGRENSRLHLPQYPNEIEVILQNASPMYLHIGDSDVKSLYNHFLSISKGSIAIRNQYASTFVLNGIVRNASDNLIETKLVLRADKILGFIHYGKEIFSCQSYRQVGLILNDVHIFQLNFENYEILRRSFIPNENAKAFPAWNAKRVEPTKSDGRPYRFKNQWEASFAFDGVARGSFDVNTLRKARFVTHQENLVGYLDFDHKLD